ncbi:hypothetical protein MMC18_006214 [Xylographa bjoerkii]|nr:hypothetical protein [Xylographa bjoerkii]
MSPPTSSRVHPKAESLLKYDFEKLACHTSNIPRGYVFVPKGDVYITRHCRTLTGKLQQTLYVVYDDATCERLGLRCPANVFEEVNADAVASAPGRRDAVQTKDLRDDRKSRAAIRRMFPRMPIDSAEAILEHGFQKGSGRVGRTTTLDEDQKVKLAVEAHIRHNFTPYETLLRERKDGDQADDHRRERARATVKPQILEILASWGPQPSPSFALPVKAIVAPAAPAVKIVARSNSPIVGDAVTQSYHMGQAAASTSEESVEMAALDTSIHAKGTRLKIHKWNEDASLGIPTARGTLTRSVVRTVEHTKSPRKVFAITSTTTTTKSPTPMEPNTVSLEASMLASISNQNPSPQDLVASTHCSTRAETSETRLLQPFTNVGEVTRVYSQESAKKLLNPAAECAQIRSASFSGPDTSNRKRTRENNEDSSSMKRPKHHMAIASKYPVGEALQHMETEVPLVVDFLSIHGSARLSVDFNAMHLDDMAESLNPTTGGPRADSFPAENASETNVALNSHGVHESELATSVTTRVAELRAEIRCRLLNTNFQKPKKKSKSLPGSLECMIINKIKRLLQGHKDKSLIDLKAWQNDFQEFSQFSERQQYNVILAEFREHLLLGRMDYNLYLMKHDEPDSAQTLELRAKQKFEAAVSAMVGTARKDYRMIKANPYYENTLSAERSWAAWQAFEFGKGGRKHGLREVLRKHQVEKTGDKGSSIDKAFVILDDEDQEEEDREIRDNAVVSHDFSFLSERPVRRSGQEHPVNPFLAQPGRETRLDSADGLAQSGKGTSSDKENTLARYGMILGGS